MRSFARLIALLLIALPILVEQAMAQITHTGSTDPVTEGWTLQTTAGGTGTAIDPDPDFPEVSSWEAVSNGLHNYQAPGPTAGTDWTLRALLRVPDLAKPANYDTALLVADDANRRWVLSFGTNANGDTLIDPEESTTITVPATQAGRSDYVLVEMAGAANLMDIFINGVEMASDVPHRSAVNASVVAFGDQTSFAQQPGRYALVEYSPGAQACRDGIDNDGDNLVDFAGGDPDCSQPNDPSEDNFDAPLTWTVGGSCIGSFSRVTGDAGCGAYANEAFSGNFSLEFRWDAPSPVIPTGIDAPVGFLETPITSIGTFDLNGFYIERGNTPPRLQITEGGALPAPYFSFNGVTQYSSSNIFRLDRVGSELRTYQDGALVHTQTGFTTNDVYLHIKAPPSPAAGPLDWVIQDYSGAFGGSNDAISIGALTYNPDLDDKIIYDWRNNREWLRWNELIVAGPGGKTYADVVDAITTGPFAGQGWNIGRNADGLAFVDAVLDGQSHSCAVDGNFNNCGAPAGDFNELVGENCTGNETIAWFLSDNGTGDEAGLIDHILSGNELLYWNERGSIAFADSVTCGGTGTSWLIYRDSEVPPDGIVGSWYFFEEAQPGAAGGPVVLTLLANDQYLIAQDGDPVSDPSGEDGLEWGTYDFDEVSSTISFTALLDTNGGWGADGATIPIALNGNQLLSGAGGELILQRIYSNSLVGAWLFDGARDDQSIVLNFLVDGTFMMIHGNNDDPCGCGQAGIEYGTYSWDAQTGAIGFTITTDTNGEFGVSSDGVSSDISTAFIVGNQLTATVEGEGSFTFTRVSAADNDGDGVANLHDNCVTTINADQNDTDGDGIGNICDADLNQDCSVNFIDLSILGSLFLGADPDADLNGDGTVNFIDLSILTSKFFLPPGPSGVPNECAIN